MHRGALGHPEGAPQPDAPRRHRSRGIPAKWVTSVERLVRNEEAQSLERLGRGDSGAQPGWAGATAEGLQVGGGSDAALS